MLHPRAADLIEFIEQYLNDNGYPPTHVEMAEALGYMHPGSIKPMLVSLEQEGYIRQNPPKKRSITLLR